MYTVRYKLSTANIAEELVTNILTRSKKEARGIANQLRNELQNEYLYPTAMAYIVKLKKLSVNEARIAFGQNKPIYYFGYNPFESCNKCYQVWANTELEACIEDNEKLFINV